MQLKSSKTNPLIRSSLLELWRESLATHGDPVKAWRDIAGNPENRSRYHRNRGKGGLVRLSWDGTATITAASLVHTIQHYGPDRIFGFTPVPAMSMVAYAAGTRFISLIGDSAISFYDWYADLQRASPQALGGSRRAEAKLFATYQSSAEILQRLARILCQKPVTELIVSV